MISQQTQHNQAFKEVNPGIFAESDEKKRLITEVEQMIHKADFIPDEQEKNWIMLLPYLSAEFLNELKQTIIRENLRKLGNKHQNKF